MKGLKRRPWSFEEQGQALTPAPVVIPIERA
jgi:hypothetical protein